jgi:hypothetical protein
VQRLPVSVQDIQPIIAAKANSSDGALHPNASVNTSPRSGRKHVAQGKSAQP